MKIFPVGILLGVLTLLGSCTDSKEKSLKAIAVQEAALSALDRDQEIPGQEQRQLTTALIDQYQEFIRTWPDDTMSSRFAFQAGIQLETLGKFKEAIASYDEIWQKHPEHRLAAVSHYRTGFICEKMLQDYAQAQERYAAFAQAHPDHPMAKNMELQLRFLGDDEGLLNAILGQGNPGTADTVNAQAQP